VGEGIHVVLIVFVAVLAEVLVVEEASRNGLAMAMLELLSSGIVAADRIAEHRRP